MFIVIGIIVYVVCALAMMIALPRRTRYTQADIVADVILGVFWPVTIVAKIFSVLMSK